MTQKNVYVFWKIRGGEAHFAIHADVAAALAHSKRVVAGAESCRSKFELVPRLAVELDTPQPSPLADQATPEKASS